jgi:hypothetical protein
MQEKPVKQLAEAAEVGQPKSQVMLPTAALLPALSMLNSMLQPTYVKRDSHDHGREAQEMLGAKIKSETTKMERKEVQQASVKTSEMTSEALLTPKVVSEIPTPLTSFTNPLAPPGLPPKTPSIRCGSAPVPAMISIVSTSSPVKAAPKRAPTVKKSDKPPFIGDKPEGLKPISKKREATRMPKAAYKAKQEANSSVTVHAKDLKPAEITNNPVPSKSNQSSKLLLSVLGIA